MGDPCSRVYLFDGVCGPRGPYNFEVLLLFRQHPEIMGAYGAETQTNYK